MKVALLADRTWLDHEASTYRHLVVGLTDEGARVVPVVPERAMAGELSLISERVDFRTSQRDWVRGYRLRRVVGQLRELGCDLLHVIDGTLARPGAAIARALGLPVLMHCWDEANAAGIVRAAHRNPHATLLAPTEGLYNAMRAAGPRANIERVPLGVMGRSNVPPPLADPSASLTAVVIVEQRVGVALEQLLRAAVRLRSEMPQLQLFLHSVGELTHRHWQAAAKLDALDMVSLTDAVSDVRGLLVQADLLLVPTATGCVRTMLLSAMATGRPVLAAPDPVLDYLVDGKTAKLVIGTSAIDWADELRAAVADPQPLRDLGESARQFVRQHYRVSACVERTIEVYRAACGEPLPFEAAGQGG